MNNKHIHFWIELDNHRSHYKAGEIIKGKVVIDAVQDLDFQWIKIGLFRYTNGQRTNAVETAKGGYYLETYGKWNASKKKIYPFDLQIPHEISYNGNYIGYDWTVEADVELTKEQSRKLSLFNLQNKKWTDVYPIEISRGMFYYDFTNAGRYLRSNSNFLKTTILGLICSGVGLSLMFIPINFWLIFGGLILLMGVFSLINTFLQFYYFRKLEVDVSTKDKEKIQLRFTFNGRRNALNNAQLGYVVREYASNIRRKQGGEIKHLLKTTVYKYHSANQVIIQENRPIYLPFPQKDMPPSAPEDAEGYHWNIIVTKKIFGIEMIGVIVRVNVDLKRK